ncbi:MAG: YihY/virulence factor BrkB family protein, partial [Spirochaetales bacterium]|nr:YihY/virulence factor BrkB family protein [Spirochaetales bacterium]
MAESEKIPLRERFIDSIADFIYVIVRSVQSIASNDVSILASGLVYSTLVAAIPCLTFFIAFMSLFGVVNSFIGLFSAFLSEIFGHEIGTSVSSMMTQYTSNAMGLGIFGLFSFVISSLFLISKIYKVINSIFCCKESTGTVRRFGSFFIFLLFTAVIISVSLVLSSYANAMLANVSGELASVPLPVRFFKKNGGYLISLICL